jgi:hypothetical protein
VTRSSGDRKARDIGIFDDGGIFDFGSERTQPASQDYENFPLLRCYRANVFDSFSDLL